MFRFALFLLIAGIITLAAAATTAEQVDYIQCFGIDVFWSNLFNYITQFRNTDYITHYIIIFSFYFQILFA